jgi:plasmid stabilization system protein ParE
MRIRWSRRAERELEAIYDYHASRSPAAAARIVLRIKYGVDLAATQPFAAPVFGRGPLRKLVITQTRYLVFYTIEQDELSVEAVFHGSRRRRRRHP